MYEILNGLREEYGEPCINRGRVALDKDRKRFRSPDINYVALLVKKNKVSGEELEWCKVFLMCAVRIIGDKLFMAIAKKTSMNISDVAEDLSQDIIVYLDEIIGLWKVDMNFHVEFLYWFGSRIRRNTSKGYSKFAKSQKSTDTDEYLLAMYKEKYESLCNNNEKFIDLETYIILTQLLTKDELSLMTRFLQANESVFKQHEILMWGNIKAKLNTEEIRELLKRSDDDVSGIRTSSF